MEFDEETYLVDDLLQVSRQVMMSFADFLSSSTSSEYHTCFSVDSQRVLHFEYIEASEFNGLIQHVYKLKSDVNLPADLNDAWKRGQISLKHVPKIYTDEEITIETYKKNVSKHMKCVVSAYRRENKLIMCDSFTFDLLSNQTF